jgi:hypothetical protein
MIEFMRRWIEQWIGISKARLRQRLADLEAAVSQLRAQLAEREQQFAVFREDTQRSRSREGDRLTSALHSQLEDLFRDLAGIVAALAERLELAGSRSLPTEVDEIVVLSRRLMTVFQSRGLSFEGRIGEIVAYDPNVHCPKTPQGDLLAGQPVVIRTSGVVFRTVRLRKAVVEAQGPVAL